MAPAPPLAGPPPTPGRYVKITMFLKKLPHVSDDYFHAYWAHNHIAPALRNPKFRNKVRRYNQHHVTPAFREQARVFGLPVLDYDGMAEIWVDSLDDWMEAVTDEAFQRESGGDEANFLLTPIHVMVGFDDLVHGGADWQPNPLNDGKTSRL